jgi:hypothetical protein
VNDHPSEALGLLMSGWRVAPSVRASDLDNARAALAAALAAGKRIDEIDLAAASRPRGPISVPTPAQSASGVLAFTQSALGLTVQNPLSVPVWANGMAEGQRLGPFIDPLGNSNIVVTVPLTESTTFTFSTAANGFATFPVVGAPSPATSLPLGPGSVWFLATLLVPGAPAGSFCGFRISGGTLTASAPITLQSGVYVVPAAATLTLQATLAPPAPGSGSPGADLTTASIDLPTTITITFTQTAATITALADAHLTLYGTTLTITWPQHTAQLVPNLPLILVPGQSDIDSFAFASVKSTMFVPSGSAKITAIGWALPIATTTIATLGDASGAGSILLGLAAGASATCAVRGQAPVGGWEITIDPTQLFVLIGGVGSANQVTYTLWPGLPPATLHASVTWSNPAGFLASFLAMPGSETLSLGGQATAHLDRPMAADGGAFPIGGNGVLSQAANASMTRTTIVAASPTPATLAQYGLALKNALIGIRAPKQFLITGPTSGTTFASADVALLFDELWLLPTLPDPYAANFDLPVLLRQEQDGGAGLLAAAVIWSGASNDLIFGFQLGSGAQATGQGPLTLFEQSALALLDLSTRVDLFGVAVTGPSNFRPSPTNIGLGFIGISLALPNTLVATFALPQFSWEPMQSTGPAPPLGPIECLPPSDGVSTRVQANDPLQTLVPFAPEPVLRNNITAVAAGAPFVAEFSLPFGLIANIQQPNKPLITQSGGMFALIQPSFASQLEGAYQLTLKPPNPTDPKAQFSGTTSVAPGYGYNVLSSNVGTMFQGEFGGANGAVPVNRIDIGGYGASIFSEWSDDGAPGPAIIKVQFQAVRGRTAYEVVKARTTLYPHCPPMVRTITISRQNGGWVQRTDTNWVAVAPGIFQFPNPAFTQNLVHRGAVAGVYNIRNVRELETVTVGIFTYQRVLFDADIGLDHRVKVIQGGTASTFSDIDGNPVTLVPARDLTGYLQILPDESAQGSPPPPTPGPPDLVQLFQTVGPITDLFACIAEIGYTASESGTQLRCSAIEIDMVTTGPSAPALAAALRAAPVLPRDGAWGFGKRPSAAAAPLALPGNFPVPIVQPKTDPGNWHIADISDVLQLGSPANVYGILQDTGTQRVLFEQPTIQDLTSGVPPGTVPSIQLPAGVAPALADVGSLLNATGLFPDISKAISLVTGGIEQLKTIPEGLHYTKEYDFTGNEPPTTLLDLGILQLTLIYADTGQGQTGSTWNAATKIIFNIDPAHTLPDSHGRNWWLTIGPISFAVTIPEFGFDPLLTIVGGFAADDHSKPGLTGLTIDYGSALDTLKSIFSKLQALASFLPGGLGAGLDVSLSGGKLTVRDTFALPTLPLGLGDLSDISLDLGLAITLSPLSADFIIGIGNPGNPFNWILSPLSGNGAIDIGVQGGAPYFMIQGGIGLGLSIDVGIAEGSASITLAVQMTVNGSTITLLIILNGQASLDVLGGLASASLSLTAGVGVSINPLPVPVITANSVGFPSEDITFIAQVAVGIHISICWVVSVDFDGSWQFSQSIHTPALTVNT